MRFSEIFGNTLKEIPSDAETISHQLLVRSGMIKQIGAGIYAFLPLGLRVLRKVENIIREEMNNAGGQELLLPSLQPIELWEKSGRLPSFGKTLFTVVDRKEHTFVLGPTHEEIITELAQFFIRSYRDLPALLYQIQNKFRDEPRPRGGLLRVREFIMKDLYSFDTDENGLNISYNKMVQAYKKIFNRCGIPHVLVEADSGAIGGKESGEFMLITEKGEDLIVHCESCGYAANLEKARSIKFEYEINKELPIEEVSTPGYKTIEEVTNFLKIAPYQTLKSVFYKADNEIIFVVTRGDCEINETKLKNILKCVELKLANDNELKNYGLIPGSASPVGVKNIKIIGDETIKLGGNFVTGANKPDTHLKNVNYPRDFKVDIIADISNASSGDLCINCKSKLTLKNGIEIGHVFKLGTFLSERFNATYIDREGKTRPIYMGCYGIGVGRLIAAIVEHNHDSKGIKWPLEVSPFQIHLCTLKPDSEKVNLEAEKIYCDLLSNGYEILFDNRQETAGVKFNDADLIGVPLRLTISPRTLEKKSIEIKWRNEDNSFIIPLEELSGYLNKQLIRKNNTES